MSIRKKHFPCGHTGLGKHCHACAQQVRILAQSASRKHQRKTKSAGSTIHDAKDVYGADLSVLPTERYRAMASTIIREITENTHQYTHYRGKRMAYDRRIISILIGRNYRLLFRELADGTKTVIKVLSHEEYNGTKPGS